MSEKKPVELFDELDGRIVDQLNDIGKRLFTAVEFLRMLAEYDDHCWSRDQSWACIGLSDILAKDAEFLLGAGWNVGGKE